MIRMVKAALFIRPLHVLSLVKVCASVRDGAGGRWYRCAVNVIRHPVLIPIVGVVFKAYCRGPTIVQVSRYSACEMVGTVQHRERLFWIGNRRVHSQLFVVLERFRRYGS